MNFWKASCCSSFNTSPVVLIKITAAYFFRFFLVKKLASLVVSIKKLFSAPNFCTAAIPTGIEAWWYPFVRENTNTRGVFLLLTNETATKAISTKQVILVIVFMMFVFFILNLFYFIFFLRSITSRQVERIIPSSCKAFLNKGSI